MVRSGLLHKLGVLLLGAAAVHVPAEARRLEASVARVESAAALFEDVRLVLDWPADADRGALELRAARLRADTLGFDLRDLRWQCALARDGQGGWSCRGGTSARDVGKATLAGSVGDAGTTLSLSKGDAEFAVQLPAAQDGTELHARALPVAWLQPLLQKAWPEARLTGGTLRGELLLASSDGGPLTLTGTLAGHGLGLDTDDGRTAAAGLGLHGRMALEFAEGATAVDVDFGIAGGEVLAGAFYAALPEQGASLALRADGSGGRWTFPAVTWRDPGVLVLEGTLAVDAGNDEPLPLLSATFSSKDLATAGERYLSGVLGLVGLGGLRTSGALEGSIAMAEGALQHLTRQRDNVAAAVEGRFAVHGLDGALGWQRSEAAEGTLHWDAARLYTLALGPADLAWQTDAGRWSLRAPATVPFYDGTLALEGFAWTPGALRGGEPELALALSLDGVALQGLTRALDWPAFGGTLSGRIPAARYENGVLRLDGGLDLQVFDGRIRVGALRMERPFGVAPTLSTDIRMELLDLVPLTGAFGFGRISGRLDGSIAGLRLVDWQPVAFDASLRTSTTADDKRRISQRAVSDLSNVGGGGIAAGLQAQVLRMFDTFPYEQIGLSCRLEHNVCNMGGLEPAGGGSGGYTIVEGSGLPHITVIGHQRRVDWPVLLARLKAATQGQGPVVD